MLFENQESNLVVNWKPASPSDRAYAEKLGLTGDEILCAFVEDQESGDEVWYFKVDGVQHRVVD